MAQDELLRADVAVGARSPVLDEDDPSAGGPGEDADVLGFDGHLLLEHSLAILQPARHRAGEAREEVAGTSNAHGSRGILVVWVDFWQSPNEERIHHGAGGVRGRPCRGLSSFATGRRRDEVQRCADEPRCGRCEGTAAER